MKPPERRLHGTSIGADRNLPRLQLEFDNGSPRKRPKFEVYEDARDIFTPRVLWWQVPVGREGLKTGVTHSPGAKCQICAMIFSNVSSSFVKSLHENQNDHKKALSFVYQLKGSGSQDQNPGTVLSVWISVGSRLLPMIQLAITSNEYRIPRAPPRAPPKARPWLKRISTFIEKPVDLTTTSSSEALDLAASWIRQCNQSHENCWQLRQTKPVFTQQTDLNQKQTYSLPTRLIDIGRIDGELKPRLCIPSKTAKPVPYITLSYRWGPSPAVLLTQESLPKLREKIPIHLLPKSNQDAIRITRFLGLRYLWIDALCIIQDLESDWNIESARMGDIYKNSYCTISASIGGEEGCFVERQPFQVNFRPSLPGRQIATPEKSPIGTTAAQSSVLQDLTSSKTLGARKPSGSDDDSLLFDFHPSLPGLKNNTLGHLSTAISAGQPSNIQNITSSNVLRVDRSSESDNESLLLTIRAIPNNPNLWATEVDASPLSRRAWTFQERLLSRRILHFTRSQVFWECSISKASETFPQLMPKNPDYILQKENHRQRITSLLDGTLTFEPFREHWDEIVEFYTDTISTRPEDKLVAISGLAKEILGDSNDSYYAGLWGKDFARTSLWYLQTPQKARLKDYRAPSWSWASVEGKAGHLASDSADNTSTPISQVRAIQTIGIDGSRCSTGQLKDGFCRILGPLRKCVRYEKRGPTHRLILDEMVSSHANDVDFFPDVFFKEMPARLACLPMLYTSCAFISGLVVEPTGKYSDEYRRVGAFRIDAESGERLFEDLGVEIVEVTII
ncbi:hypothetical protein G7Y89_g1777 [Cudoniella acicularis]|uniref:Heterokaryon incompatibility domain-containing protein n=1 Tax=Cudoniella acicularis TaxID=354080 RepID=A0A8H4W7J8_9HELO|nr:hypothetical protein G7Y89_g1777 [Cudoniella acicularis]